MEREGGETEGREEEGWDQGASSSQSFISRQRRGNYNSMRGETGWRKRKLWFIQSDFGRFHHLLVEFPAAEELLHFLKTARIRKSKNCFYTAEASPRTRGPKHTAVFLWEEEATSGGHAGIRVLLEEFWKRRRRGKGAPHWGRASSPSDSRASYRVCHIHVSRCRNINSLKVRRSTFGYYHFVGTLFFAPRIAQPSAAEWISHQSEVSTNSSSRHPIRWWSIDLRDLDVIKLFRSS